LITKSYFSRRKILETPIFLELFRERSFHLLLKFLRFVDKESTMGPFAVPKDCINSNPYWII
jgi:hypothetical protein